MFTLGALLLCLAVGVQCNFNGGYGQGGYYQRPPPQQYYQRPYFPQNRPYPGPGPSCPPHFCPSAHCPKICPSNQFCHHACSSASECEETSCAECELCPSCEENEPSGSCEECDCSSTSCEEIHCSTCETCISPSECPSDADVSCSECPSDVDGSCPECTSCPEDDACPSPSDCETSITECPSDEDEPFCSQEALEYDAIYEACVVFLDGTGPPCLERFISCPFAALNPLALLDSRTAVKGVGKNVQNPQKVTTQKTTKKVANPTAKNSVSSTKSNGLKNVIEKVLGGTTTAKRPKRTIASSVEGICDEVATLIVDLVATIEGHGLCCDLTGLALHATDATPAKISQSLAKKKTASKVQTKAAKKTTKNTATSLNQKTTKKATAAKKDTPAKKATAAKKDTPAQKTTAAKKDSPSSKATAKKTKVQTKKD